MIRKSVMLFCDQSRAFDVFTTRMSEWWPAERRHTGDPASEIRMLATGRFWERSADGHEVELGLVRVWEPPARLVLDFYVGTSAEHPTQVVVCFVPVEGGTRVEIDHHSTDTSWEVWEARVTRFDESWNLVLAALARAIR
jgi:hypothetical protein